MGLRQNKMSQVPTWTDQQNQEGIECKNGTIFPFWIREFERVYGEIPSEKIQKVIEMIEGKETGKTEIVQNDKITVINQLPSVLSGKRIIVSQDIEELKKMSTFDRLLLFQRTNHAHIKTKRKGKGEVSYVEGNFMQLEANVAFLFSWSDFIVDKFSDEVGCTVMGGVTAIIDGQEVTHTAIGIDLQEYGREDKKPVFTKHELFKNAHMDMIKKALSKFGFNNDVYRGDV